MRSALSLFPQRLLGSLHPSSKGPECPFELASRRSNIQVSLHLSPPTSPESSFAISTYHMPCAFRTPQMMALHSSLSVRNLQERAKEWGAGRAVLAGDFNLKPDSGLYRMITTGECPKDDKETYPLKKGVEGERAVGWGGGGGGARIAARRIAARRSAARRSAAKEERSDGFDITSLSIHLSADLPLNPPPHPP